MLLQHETVRYDLCGHVIIGDLNIVQDQEVINFLKKVLKYRPLPKKKLKRVFSILNFIVSSLTMLFSPIVKIGINGRNLTKAIRLLFR